MLNGTEPRSPRSILVTPGPTSSTIPMFSWPETLPSSTLVLPSYMCRWEPRRAYDGLSYDAVWLDEALAPLLRQVSVRDQFQAAAWG